MEDGSITDSQITASSFHKAPAERPPDNCKPKNGRLNQKGNEGVVGGWCPAESDRQTPWFQVDLRTTNQVEGVIIQGSTDPLNSYKDWVTHYKVSYSDDQRTWHYAGGSSLQTAKVFRGNVDDVAAVTSIFQRPIRARYVRILPTRYKEWPSMRIELIGCKDDVLDLINNRPFSTYDHDNDGDAANCAGLLEGGWWFDLCSGVPLYSGYHEKVVESNLNGDYSHYVDSINEYRGMRWSTWEGRHIVKSEMRMRREG
ncbi:lactadherin-like [Asterias rubens]|uniref:lactadherin-like n=1 Tax=Asterias rubens TaxID=7604 RepID=UPI001454F5E0|nr:lactadherin-like [Asterias rubens]